MSDLTFYTVGNRGTIRQTSKYDPDKACADLYRAMEGLGTDEDGIIQVVCSHSFHQRQELKEIYQQKYSKNLEKELDSELSFSFAKTVLALMKQPEQYILECIHQAISKSKAAQLIKQLQKLYKKGFFGADEYSLIALLCPRTNAELDTIKILYKQRYENELQDDIGVDLGDDLRSLILDMISGEREMDEVVDMEKVMEDADNLHAASLVPVGEICGTKERVLQQILNTRSYDHLRHLISAYKETSSKTIEEYIECTNLTHDLKEAYLAICKILRSEPEFYAERLREAIQGLGTDDDTLISIIVLRSEIDLRDIMTCYHKKFGVTLEEDVAGDTSGDYKQIMMTIMTLPDEGEEGILEGEGNIEEEMVEEQADEVTITAAAPSEGEEEEDQVFNEDPREVEEERENEDTEKVEEKKGNEEEEKVEEKKGNEEAEDEGVKREDKQEEKIEESKEIEVEEIKEVVEVVEVKETIETIVVEPEHEGAEAEPEVSGEKEIKEVDKEETVNVEAEESGTEEKTAAAEVIEGVEDGGAGLTGVSGG